jgi:WD40 repeat protein
VFDVRANVNKEMKPLMDAKLEKNKVTCLFLTDDGKYLLSGYKKGTLALWDMVNYAILRIIDDVHVTEVTQAKIFNVTEDDTIQIISCEDSGKVWCVDVKKGKFFGV